MKLTTNYIVYLDSSNRVYCAKCRLTGRFVKRALAQAEYSLEYVYNCYMSLFILIYIIVAMNVQIGLETIVATSNNVIDKTFNSYFGLEYELIKPN